METMSTLQQKAQSVSSYAKFESIIPVQLEFRGEFGGRSPHDKSIKKW
jgi:hypothetical protein